MLALSPQSLVYHMKEEPVGSTKIQKGEPIFYGARDDAQLCCKFKQSSSQEFGNLYTAIRALAISILRAFRAPK